MYGRRVPAVIERNEEGYLVANGSALHGCHTQGRSMDELLERVKEAMQLCLKVQGDDTTLDSSSGPGRYTRLCETRKIIHRYGKVSLQGRFVREVRLAAVCLRLFLILFFCILTACGNPRPDWTTTQVIEAFRKAGLAVEQVHNPGEDEDLPQEEGVEVVTFFIPHATGGAYGYIFSLPSATRAEQLKQSSDASPEPSREGFSSTTFTHDNVYVMLSGNVPGAVLQQYEMALRGLK